MTEVTNCLECQKYRGNDTCWSYGKMTLWEQVKKIIFGCEKFRES